MPSDGIQLNNPALLTWARERANLSAQQLAGGLTAALGEDYYPVDVIAAENGDRNLTILELYVWAEICDTNVAALYLPETPAEQTEAEHREEIIQELEYLRSVANTELIDEAIEIIRETIRKDGDTDG